MTAPVLLPELDRFGLRGPKCCFRLVSPVHRMRKQLRPLFRGLSRPCGQPVFAGRAKREELCPPEWQGRSRQTARLRFPVPMWVARKEKEANPRVAPRGTRNAPLAAQEREAEVRKEQSRKAMK